jgi:hypothetical protein
MRDQAGRRGVRRTVAALLTVIVLLPGCSRLRHHTTTRKGTVTVTPASGPPGTAFSLVAGGFRPDEPMTFEIDIPKHPKFVGPSHKAGADGRVSTTYTPLNGDPPGTYQIKAVGSRGTRAQGQLNVVAGSTPTTTK